MVPSDTSLAQLRRGVVEYCALALLRERQRYGLEIARELQEVGELVASEGTVYPMLSRLRRAGAVESLWEESNAGPPRRYYRLTPAGRAGLAAFTSDWRRFRDGVDSLLNEEDKV